MNCENSIHALLYPCGTSWTGMFLVLRDSGNILIDTAFEPAVDAFLVPKLNELGMTLEDIDFVINTHVHGDHISGNAALRKRTKAKFAAFELSAPKLRDPYPSMNLIRSRFAPELPFRPVAPGIEPLEPDMILKDREFLGSLHIIHTPGHDSDSISLFDPQTGTLFSGDSLQGRGTHSAGVAFYQDLNEYRYTLDTVEKLAPSRILAAHPFQPTDGIIENVSEFLQLCRNTTEEYSRILKSAKKHCRRMEEFVEELLCNAGINRNPTLPVLTWHTVATHLENLKNED